jgi:endonuclease III
LSNSKSRRSNSINSLRVPCSGALRIMIPIDRVEYNGFMVPKNRKSNTAKQPDRCKQILNGLEDAYPDAQCALLHSNPLELLIATILSAQCTDARVNIVTRGLFGKYRSPHDYVGVSQEELEEDIRSTGFYRNKAKSIRGACAMILEKFGGAVPDSMEELLQLPGVARKTANVVLGVAFGKADGIVVDTHVFRVSRRLDLSDSETPENVERDLMRIVPKARWISFSHQMILHGRAICKARNPLCVQCPVGKVCESEEKTTG